MLGIKNRKDGRYLDRPPRNGLANAARRGASLSLSKTRTRAVADVGDEPRSGLTGVRNLSRVGIEVDYGLASNTHFAGTQNGVLICRKIEELPLGLRFSAPSVGVSTDRCYGVTEAPPDQVVESSGDR